MVLWSNLFGSVADADEDEDSPFSQAQKGVRPSRLFARFASAARTARGAHVL